MKISLNWLKDFVDIDISHERLADILMNAGLEVEGISKLGEGLDNVVIARILSMRPHPNADRLTLCSVTTGEKTHAIVCGAKNMKEGDHVALALPGAHLPNGMKIAKSKIRGEVSEGMLCSEVELGLAKESAGIMILPDALGLGDSFAKALMLEDTVFEINITPNRPDCLSVIGIAREVAALTGKELKRSPMVLEEALNIAGPASAEISVDIEDKEACPRYTAKVIPGVKITPSPLWLKRRLEASGVRAINNVVDITNYVMLETGQPLHAFDLNLLSGNKIIVRRADGSENITTLDGMERVLDKDTLIIADSERPLAVAGVMGGKGSEVTEATVDILLESAYFNPAVVRRTAKRLGLHTESSHRFERGVDPNGVLDASDRAAQLIIKLAGAKAPSKTQDEYPVKVNPVNIEMRLSRAKSILGLGLNADLIIDGFKRLQFDVDRVDGDKIKVTPPTFRVDLTREIDLIEEVARLIGYDSIPVTYPKLEAQAGKKDKKGLLEDKIRGLLTGLGFYETITYSFLSPKAISPFLPNWGDPIKLRNPISEEQSVMRSTVIPSLLEVIERNLNHSNENLRFFEIGRVFPYHNDRDNKEERTVVSGIMHGKRYGQTWNLPADELDFFDVKGVVENFLDDMATFIPCETIQYLHPGKTAIVNVDGLDVGIIGELHPDVMSAFDIKGKAYVFEIELNPIMEAARAASFVYIPRFPAVSRDIAVVVDNDVPAERVYRTIKGVDPLISDVYLFDHYKGKHISEGKKSLAYSIRYQAMDRTLREEEVNVIHEKVLSVIQETVGGALRE